MKYKANLIEVQYMILSHYNKMKNTMETQLWL